MSNHTELSKKTKTILVVSATGVVIGSIIIKRKITAREIAAATEAVAKWTEQTNQAGFEVVLLTKPGIDKINSLTDNALKFVAS